MPSLNRQGQKEAGRAQMETHKTRGQRQGTGKNGKKGKTRAEKMVPQSRRLRKKEKAELTNPTRPEAEGQRAQVEADKSIPSEDSYLSSQVGEATPVPREGTGPEDELEPNGREEDAKRERNTIEGRSGDAPKGGGEGSTGKENENYEKRKGKEEEEDTKAGKLREAWKWAWRRFHHENVET